jgi:hypothetical protein
VAFQRRQALARFHVPDLEGRVPGCRHDGFAVGRKNAGRDPITAMFFEISGNTFTVVIYASPPLSGGGVEPPNAKLATFRKIRLPVTLELLELLATVNIPQADRRVTRPTDELPRIRRVEMDARDLLAAIVSNVSFTGNCSTPLPR